MSMQRIFDVARKLGTPVIMTDPAGREPLVVLPLDQFEAMAGVSSDQEEPTVVPEAMAPASRSKMDKNTHNKAKNDERVEQAAELATINVEAQDLALEERFYLEPLEGADGLEA
jgi:hypothetical protein